LRAQLADPILVSYLREHSLDLALKCIQRKKERSMGVLVERENRLEVIEYYELDPSQEYPFAYAGMMAISFSFLRKMASIDLPLHRVWKKSGKKMAWKRERLIFDALHYAEKSGAVCYPAETIYAPIKTLEDASDNR